MCLCLFSSGSNEPCSRMVWQDLTLDPASEVLTEVLCVKVPFCCFSYIYMFLCRRERIEQSKNSDPAKVHTFTIEKRTAVLLGLGLEMF